MWHHAIWWKYTYIPEEPTASIFRVEGSSGLCISVRRTRSKLSWLSSCESFGMNRYYLQWHPHRWIKTTVTYDDLKTGAAGSFELSINFYKIHGITSQKTAWSIATGMEISNLTFRKLFSMYMRYSLKVCHINFINLLKDRNLVSTVMLLFLFSLWSTNETKCWYNLHGMYDVCVPIRS